MTLKKPIICLGIAVADLIGGPVHQLPGRGRLELVDRMGLFTGGCAVNTATALARFGLPVAVIGKVGDDRLGDFLVNALADQNVETKAIRQDADAGTSATMVMVDPDGERRFVHYIGANACLTADDVELSMIDRAALLHIGGCFVMPGLDGEPTVSILRYAREVNVTTFLDTAWDAQDRWLGLIAPYLPLIDYMVPSLSEARAITGHEEPADIAYSLIEMGVGTVAIKMGVDGCLVMGADGQPHQFPAYEVNVVDATGAGDAFAAGFIAGVYLDWPLEQTAALANAAGALCVTAMGAQGGLRSLEGTLSFMSDRGLL